MAKYFLQGEICSESLLVYASQKSDSATILATS